MVKSAKAIFGNTDFLTAQSFIYTRTNFFGQIGNTVVLSCVISAIGDDIFNKVRQSGLDLEDKFFDLESTVPERIKECLDFIQASIKDSESLQIQLVFWQENVLYIQSAGRQQAYILREGRLINLTSSDEQLVSGHIKLGDRLLLMSPRFEAETAVKVDGQALLVEDKKDQEVTFPDWDKRLVDDLINSALDGLDELIASHFNTSQKVEPIAVVLIDHQSEDDFKVIDPETLIKLQTEQSSKEIHQSPGAAIFSSPADSRLSNFGRPANPIIPQIIALVNKIFSRFWRSPRGRLILLAALLLMVGGITGLIYLQTGRAIQNREQNAQLFQVQTLLTLAQSQQDSNPEEAKKNLAQARTSISEILNKNPKSAPAQALEKQINDSATNILKIYQITDFPVLLSLDLIKAGFHTTKMSYSVGLALLLDENQKTLVTLDLAKKTHQLLGGSTQLGDAKSASLNGDIAYAYSPDKGLSKVNLADKKPQVAVKPDTDWGNITDLYAFAGNVYLLDSLKNKIYKYVTIKSGLSDRLDYLKDGVQPDFSGAFRLQIDYSVWVLKSPPDILRFTAGAPDNFSIGGLDQPIGNKIASIFPSENEDKLYILDSENARVVIVKKSGQYIAQYTGDKFKTASDLIVDDEKKKLYLLDQDKIYAIDLK